MVPRELSRRKLFSVSSVAFIGFAGCQAIESGQTRTDSENESEPNPTQAETSTATPSPTATMTPADIGQNDFSMTVKTVQQFTDAHPAQFQMSLSNTSGDPLIVDRFQLGPQTSHYTINHESAEAKLVVPPTKMVPEALTDPQTGDEITSTPDQTDGCWRLNAELLLSGVPKTGQLAAGDTIREMFNVYTHRETDGCLQPGMYRFSEKHSFQRGPIDMKTNVGGSIPVSFETTLEITEDTELLIEAVDVSLPST